MLARDPGSFPESAKQERKSTLGERTTRLREEEVILIGTCPLETRCGEAVLIQICQQVAQSLMAQRKSSLF